MQKMGLRSLIRAKKRSRLVQGISDVHVPNVLKRDFCATAPNQKWVTDITEFKVNGQKLYLSACMDLYNGEIIAHRMADRPVFELVFGTFEVALASLEDSSKLTVHSDQGWQYKMQAVCGWAAPNTDTTLAKAVSVPARMSMGAVASQMVSMRIT